LTDCDTSLPIDTSTGSMLRTSKISGSSQSVISTTCASAVAVDAFSKWIV